MSFYPLRPVSISISLILAASFPTPARAAGVAPLLPDQGAAQYKLSWGDEFDGETLKASEWDYRLGDRLGSRNLPENVTVSGGRLRILLKKESAGELDYTAGGVISKREFLHGYYEARIKMPPGGGWHSSFWMMKNTPGEEGRRQEIDVVEHDSKNPKDYGINFHLWKPEHKVISGTRPKTPDLSAGFHVWGCEYTPAQLRYYFDGKLVHVIDVDAYLPDKQNIWLTSVAWTRLPWSKDAKVDDTRLPSSVEFDYIRFYEPKDKAAADALNVPVRFVPESKPPGAQPGK